MSDEQEIIVEIMETNISPAISSQIDASGADDDSPTDDSVPNANLLVQTINPETNDEVVEELPSNASFDVDPAEQTIEVEISVSEDRELSISQQSSDITDKTEQMDITTATSTAVEAVPNLPEISLLQNDEDSVEPMQTGISVGTTQIVDKAADTDPESTPTLEPSESEEPVAENTAKELEKPTVLSVESLHIPSTNSQQAEPQNITTTETEADDTTDDIIVMSVTSNTDSGSTITVKNEPSRQEQKPAQMSNPIVISAKNPRVAPKKPVLKCIIPFCGSNNKPAINVSGRRCIVFHPFPKDADLLKPWLKFVQEKAPNTFKSLTPIQVHSSRLCSNHFGAKCYKDGEVTIGNLKTDSRPTMMVKYRVVSDHLQPLIPGTIAPQPTQIYTPKLEISIKGKPQPKKSAKAKPSVAKPSVEKPSVEKPSVEKPLVKKTIKKEGQELQVLAGQRNYVCAVRLCPIKHHDKDGNLMSKFYRIPAGARRAEFLKIARLEKPLVTSGWDHMRVCSNHFKLNMFVNPIEGLGLAHNARPVILDFEASSDALVSYRSRKVKQPRDIEIENFNKKPDGIPDLDKYESYKGATKYEVLRCCAHNCGNTYQLIQYIRDNRDTVLFHVFPTDPHRVKRWIDLGMMKWLHANCSTEFIQKNMLLCSNHFELSEYKNEQLEIGCLLEDAEPTLFDFISEIRHGKRKPRLKRKLNTPAVSGAALAKRRKIFREVRLGVSETVAEPLQLVTVSYASSDAKKLALKKLPRCEWVNSQAEKLSSSCVVQDCLNMRDGNTKQIFIQHEDQRTVQLHAMPRDPIRSAKWLTYLNKVGMKPANFHEVQMLCSLHFTEEQYVDTDCTVLHNHAVPDIYERAGSKLVVSLQRLNDDLDNDEEVTPTSVRNCSQSHALYDDKMLTKCCLKYCQNTFLQLSIIHSKPGRPVRFHEIPKHVTHSASWLKFCREDLDKSQSPRTICSLHFTSDMYTDDKCLNLKPDAVPTQHLNQLKVYTPEKVVLQYYDYFKLNKSSEVPAVAEKYDPSKHGALTNNMSHTVAKLYRRIGYRETFDSLPNLSRFQKRMRRELDEEISELESELISLDAKLPPKSIFLEVVKVDNDNPAEPAQLYSFLEFWRLIKENGVKQYQIKLMANGAIQQRSQVGEIINLITSRNPEIYSKHLLPETKLGKPVQPAWHHQYARKSPTKSKNSSKQQKASLQVLSDDENGVPLPEPSAEKFVMNFRKESGVKRKPTSSKPSSREYIPSRVMTEIEYFNMILSKDYGDLTRQEFADIKRYFRQIHEEKEVSKEQGLVNMELRKQVTDLESKVDYLTAVNEKYKDGSKLTYKEIRSVIDKLLPVKTANMVHVQLLNGSSGARNFKFGKEYMEFAIRLFNISARAYEFLAKYICMPAHRDLRRYENALSLEYSTSAAETDEEEEMKKKMNDDETSAGNFKDKRPNYLLSRKRKSIREYGKNRQKIANRYNERELKRQKETSGFVEMVRPHWRKEDFDLEQEVLSLGQAEKEPLEEQPLQAAENSSKPDEPQPDLATEAVAADTGIEQEPSENPKDELTDVANQDKSEISQSTVECTPKEPQSKIVDMDKVELTHEGKPVKVLQGFMTDSKDTVFVVETEEGERVVTHSKAHRIINGRVECLPVPPQLAQKYKKPAGAVKPTLPITYTNEELAKIYKHVIDRLNQSKADPNHTDNNPVKIVAIGGKPVRGPALKRAIMPKTVTLTEPVKIKPKPVETDKPIIFDPKDFTPNISRSLLTSNVAQTVEIQQGEITSNEQNEPELYTEQDIPLESTSEPFVYHIDG